MTSKQSQKRGIALVIVLGMLALLVMLAVSFSVFMRTERHAAGGFQHDVRARVLLEAAATRAIEDLDANLAGRVYPDWLARASQSANTNRLSTNDVWATQVPGSLLDDAQFPSGFGWLAVPNGRIGYVIVNASGLLDANSAGGSVRASGGNPNEISLSKLTEVTSTANLVANRDYESVGEMRRRAGAAAGFTDVRSMVTFSMSPTNVAQAPIDMSTLVDKAALTAKKADIIAALNAMAGGSGMDPNMAFDALVDYVDADSEPENLNEPCVERVPMINEVNYQPLIGGSNLIFRFEVELAYPFMSVNPASYELQYKYTIAGPPGFPSPGTIENKSIVKTYGDVIGSYPKVPPISAPPVIIPPAFAGTTAKFTVTVQYLKLVDTVTGKVVDQVLNPNLNTPTPPEIVVPAAGGAMGTVGGAECLDPRYNHLNTLWFPYFVIKLIWPDSDPAVATKGTLGLKNACTTSQLKKTTTDGHEWMHVANKPFQSVGEWSYIVRGGSVLADTWKTFRLVNEGTQKADPIYTYFTVKPPTATQKGFVNPNTDVTAVLAAVFKDMPLDAYPGQGGAPTVDDAQATQLATAWMSDPTWSVGYSTKQDMISNSNYIDRLATMVSAMPYKEFRKEAGVRNLFGLLNPRQNYFIIALFAQSSAQVNMPITNGVRRVMDTVRSDQTGVLELWRDPIARISGGVTNHPMFIRRFDILNQE